MIALTFCAWAVLQLLKSCFLLQSIANVALWTHCNVLFLIFLLFVLLVIMLSLTLMVYNLMVLPRPRHYRTLILFIY